MPASPTGNLWLGLSTALLIASVWYLPHSDFMTKLLAADQTRGDAQASPLSLYNYLRYFRFFVSYHLGALATWIIVPTALWPWLRAWYCAARCRRAAHSSGCACCPPISCCCCWTRAARVSSYQRCRALLCCAPSGCGNTASRPRLALGALWLVILGLQWSIFTFGVFDSLYARTAALWTSRDYSVQPASYETDQRYWIGPDILARGDCGQGPSGAADRRAGQRCRSCIGACSST